MKKHQTSSAFGLILLCTLILTCSAQAEKKNHSMEIEKKILEQLGDQFELKRWDIAAVEKIAKGPATIEKSTIKIKAIAKESLYLPAGQGENGQRAVRLSQAAGEPVEFQGYLIQAIIPGMAQQPPIQVIIAPYHSKGQPLNRFPSNVQKVEPKTASNPPPSKSEHVKQPPLSPPEPSMPAPASPSKPAPDHQGEFSELMAVYKEAGEIWGIKQASMPVILRNIKVTEDKGLEGTIHYPFQELANPFTIYSGGGQMMLEVKAATPTDRGARRDTLPCHADGELLIAESIRVSRSGMRFALTPEQNLRFKKRFEKQIDPFKSGVNVKDCFYINGKILNVDTLEEISSSWVQSASAIRVKNMPDRFVSAELGYGRTMHPSGGHPAIEVKTVEPRGRMPIEPLSAFKDGAWVSNDLSEYVVLRDGDVWHGKVNWMHNSAKQERNVTNLGILNHLEPIAWYKNDFYFYNQQGADTPILRIDVKTGELEEMEETKALARHSFGSPDGRFLFFSDGRARYLPSGTESLIHVYDCRNRQTFTMDATIDRRIYIGKMKEPSQPLKIEPRQWLSDSLFITDIGWYDLEKRQRTLFIEKQGIIRSRPEHKYRVTNYSFLPVTDFVDITVWSFNAKDKMVINRRYRVNRTRQKAIELPMEFDRRPHNNANITWIDENRYVFSRKQGSLKDIGTWLYDVRTQTHRRLTPLYGNDQVGAQNYCMKSEHKGRWTAPFYFYNQHLVFADKERIVFGVKKGNTSKLVSVPLIGGNIAEIALNGRPQEVRRILPFSIELPLSNHY
jgi:hypothetical protein